VTASLAAGGFAPDELVVDVVCADREIDIIDINNHVLIEIFFTSVSSPQEVAKHRCLLVSTLGASMRAGKQVDPRAVARTTP
jgi:hypothetical protein